MAIAAPDPNLTSGACPESGLADGPLRFGGYALDSRMIVGTGKYSSFEVMRAAHRASGSQMVTVALRRVDLKNPANNILNFIDRDRMHLLPNTAGCYTAGDAVKVARLAREVELGDLVKVEVIGDEKTLMPCPVGTLEATRILAAEGFTVMAYCSDDIVLCRRLEEAGAAVVMPLGSPIGSGRGILNPSNIRIIKELLTVPVVVDAGVGTASDCALAMELGVDGILLNTAIAASGDPVAMAAACRDATRAGRTAFLAGRMEKRRYASASSPIKDF
ncbi:MAG: thiazole synthase [Candidatus Sumerlaeia bacterium]|nr:thiazole synthase [Candidatus Sumerlaeia bacterium]